MATGVTSDTSTAQLLKLRFEQFELDEADARLTRAGQAVPLAPKPFAVLCALARTPRTLVTKNALLDSVWGHRFVSDSVLKTTISELRAALHDDPREPRYIETVSRRGYRFIAAVSAPAAREGTTRAGAVTNAGPSLVPSSLIGRSDALEQLRQAWHLARAGSRKIVWIAGEPGVGKTTLIDHFTAELGDACCARGQCVEQYGEGEPYLPVLEALAELCRRDDALLPLIRTVAPTWLLQLPWLSSGNEREALRRELSGAGQARMLRELGELLDRYTENRPLVLVTEDLHWSDPATVQLIDYIARRRGTTRLLWLASFRLTDIIAADHPVSALRAELRLHGLAQEIVLDAFSETEVADYVRARIPRLAADEPFVRTLHGRTEGLPLFVADVLDELMDDRNPDVEEPSSSPLRLVATVVPDTLSGIIERYIQHLTPAERALLEAASVCGLEFRVSTVAQVLQGDPVSLAELCGELARRQRWLSDLPLEHPGTTRDGGGYAFRHALYREVLYRRIGPLARSQLHRKVACSLERQRGEGGAVSPVELASHFELGNEPMRALHYYAEAAESALLHFSPTQTMSLTERATALLELIEDSDDRASLEITVMTLRGAAAIESEGIASGEVKRAFERALSRLERVPRHPLRGLFLNALGLSLYMRGELAEAHRLAQHAHDIGVASGDRTVLLCAYLIHGLVQHLRGSPRTACEWLEKALAASEELDGSTAPAVFSADPGVLILALLAIESLNLGRVDQARAYMRASYARSCELREPGPQSAALWFNALIEVRMNAPDRVKEVADQLRELAEQYEDAALPQIHAARLWFEGWAEAHLGDPRTAHRRIREGYEEAVRLGIRAWGSEVLGYAAEALARAGDWHAAREQLEQAMRCANEIGERQYLTQLLLLDASIADALGEPDRACELRRQAVAEARAEEAVWLQLIALSAVCESPHASAKDFQSLRRVLDGLTEGLETGPVARARALLSTRNSARVQNTSNRLVSR